MIPLGFNCCSSGGGIWSMPQVTMILSKGAAVLPAIIAVAASGRDRGIFAITIADQPVIDPARAASEFGNDLDRPEPGGQIAQQGRLVARAGADFEHLVALANAKRARHAPHRARRSDRDAEADVEIMPDIGVLAILRQHEFLARRHQEGALVGRGPQIIEAESS